MNLYILTFVYPTETVPSFIVTNTLPTFIVRRFELGQGCSNEMNPVRIVIRSSDISIRDNSRQTEPPGAPQMGR